MVARTVNKKYVEEQPEAQTAMWAEWNRLDKKGTWDMGSVWEWADVSMEAREAQGKLKAQVGRAFGICVEKGSELAAGAKGIQYKRNMRLWRRSRT